MCGHVGIAGTLNLADEKTLKRLLLFDYLRGPDSTGFASKNKTTNEISLTKMASHPLDLFDSKAFVSALNAYTSDVFLGHNRAATKGKINALNAHPFECGHIVGAHNGTLDDRSWAELDKLLDTDTEVDSKAIFLVLEKFGIDELVKHMYGAWALVWIDLKENTLNFLRNKERPLWYATTGEGEKLFWASEYPMLDCALALSDKEYKLDLDKDGAAFFPFTVNTLYSWDLDALKSPITDSVPVCRVLEEREVPAKPTSNFTQATTYTMGTNRGTTNSTTTTYPSRSPIQLYGSEKDPFAGVISKHTFDGLALYGCSYCGEKIEDDGKAVTVYYDEEIVLCSDCTGPRHDSRVYLEPSGFDFMQKVLV